MEERNLFFTEKIKIIAATNYDQKIKFSTILMIVLLKIITILVILHIIDFNIMLIIFLFISLECF